jgi:hypothetical protein
VPAGVRAVLPHLSPLRNWGLAARPHPHRGVEGVGVSAGDFHLPPLGGAQVRAQVWLQEQVQERSQAAEVAGVEQP